MISAISRFFVLGFVLPLVFSSMMYIGATSTYTSGVFDHAGFHQQYDNGIYKYRILGTQSLLMFKALIDDRKLPRFKPNILADERLEVDPAYYAAYFFSNTIYLLLTCGFLFFIFEGQKNRYFNQVDLPVICLTLLMAITQYVIVPYDTLSYLFLVTGILLTLKREPSALISILLMLTMILATLTRESSLLIGSFYAAYHWKRLLKISPRKLNGHQVTFLLLIISFIGTYISLRLALGFENAVFQDFQFVKSINVVSLSSMLFFIGFLFILFMTNPVSSRMKVFLLTSLPYVLMIVLFAMPSEMRLWVPLLIPLMILKMRNGCDDDARTGYQEERMRPCASVI